MSVCRNYTNLILYMKLADTFMYHFSLPIDKNCVWNRFPCVLISESIVSEVVTVNTTKRTLFLVFYLEKSVTWIYKGKCIAQFVYIQKIKRKSWLHRIQRNYTYIEFSIRILKKFKFYEFQHANERAYHRNVVVGFGVM